MDQITQINDFRVKNYNEIVLQLECRNALWDTYPTHAQHVCIIQGVVDNVCGVLSM